ncbi:Protein of unknown function (DUF1501) [hydrothermal vent metagenome]|uniref:DUF1501 domain-containing protein n=1 Tax=hydrothermal vent metagenome TaxID=652676 RepID=A0A3B1DY81_9ZZZZ
MNLHNSRAFTRRHFLGTGLTLASASLALPAFLQRSAFGLPMAAPEMSSIPGVNENNILVVLQLGGGNDGLNTVVPFTDDNYYRRRAGIGVAANQVLPLSQSDRIGLHPALAPFKELYDEGLLSIIQGIGYPNPNRSHFKSMDIWHTADTSGTGQGWLGKYFDAECIGYGKGESGSPEGPPPEGEMQGQPGIAIGREAPLAMQGRKAKPISFETPDLFRWTGEEIHESLAKPYTEITQHGLRDGIDPNSAAGFLMRTTLDAQVSSDLIRKAVRQQPLAQYPGNALARDMAMVASMIRAGLNTRVYYVSLGGFDTHAGQGNQNGRHANLLRTFSTTLRAFYQDLNASENDSRVLTMVFSEFGRRVSQNASGGTDHGTAAPMFLVGPMVKPGLIGDHPSLTDLDNGDLKYNIDFRSVYASILEDWLSADSKVILERNYRKLPVLT